MDAIDRQWDEHLEELKQNPRQNWEKFLEESPELRERIRGGEDVGNEVTWSFGSVTINHSLVGQPKRGSPEVYEEAHKWLELIEQSDRHAKHGGAHVYSQFVCELYAKGAPDIDRGIRAMRRVLSSGDVSAIMARKAYFSLLMYCDRGSEHILQGARYYRERNFPFSMDCYAYVSHLFDMDSPAFVDELRAGAETAVDNISHKSFQPWYFEYMLRIHFFRLKRMGFFDTVFDRPWLKEVGLSEAAVKSLKGFPSQKHFANRFDHWITIFNVMLKRSKNKIKVLNAILESTNTSSWNQVKKSMRTLRRLVTLEQLPGEQVSKFYKKWSKRIQLIDDPRNVLRRAVERVFLRNLRQSMGSVGTVRLMFQEYAPDDKSMRKKWQHARRVASILQRRGLIEMFSSAAAFLEEDGIDILKGLLRELAESPVVGKRIDYAKRHKRMIDELGFETEFVERWKEDYNKDIPIFKAGAEKEAKQALIEQSARQIKNHIGGAKIVEGPLFSLLPQVEALLEKLSKGESDQIAVEALWKRFEENYTDIRKTYGDLFANIRVDLKNLMLGLTKGVRVAKKYERVQITGGVVEMAWHGNVPGETCQTLFHEYSDDTNGRGQPLNKIRWGQFKVANYIIDGEVVARKLLEVTMDEEGNEHLLVGMPYVAGSFRRLHELDGAIEEYAAGVGIPSDRIHPLDSENTENVPLPLRTGNEIYRDAKLDELDPKKIKKNKPGPGGVRGPGGSINSSPVSGSKIQMSSSMIRSTMLFLRQLGCQINTRHSIR
jgi:hypothetical protein